MLLTLKSLDCCSQKQFSCLELNLRQTLSEKDILVIHQQLLDYTYAQDFSQRQFY